MNHLNRSLLAHIAASPTAFHAVDTAEKLLREADFTPLCAAEDW